MTLSFRSAFILVALLTTIPLFAAAPTPIACPGSLLANVPTLDAQALDNSAPSLPSAQPFTPEPTPLAPYCHACISGFSSPVMTGSGPDCTSATANLRAQLSAFANAECAVESQYGRCEFYVIHTTACYDAETTKTILRDGYTNFSCWMPIC
jgi:hypothetical protein